MTISPFDSINFNEIAQQAIKEVKRESNSLVFWLFVMKSRRACFRALEEKKLVTKEKNITKMWNKQMDYLYKAMRKARGEQYAA